MFPLPIRVRLALGADLTADPATWTWTDITPYARPRITITRGQPDESSQAPPGSCRLRVDNTGGRFVTRNPMGPWYPLLRRNTPLRVEVQVSGVWYTRFTGHINELPPAFVPGSTDTYVDLVASGITRRLGQGAAPLPSTPFRYIPGTSPVAYWPLEDGQLSSQGAALVGGLPLTSFVGSHPSGAVVTSAQWGRGDMAPWLPPAVSRSGNAGLTAVWAPINMPYTSTRWCVDFMYRSGTDAGDGAVDVNPSYLGGFLGWPQLLLSPSVRGVDVAVNGEPEVNGTSSTLYDGQPHHVRWDVFQAAAKVSWNVYVDGVVVNTGTTSGSLTLPIMQTIALVASAQNGADMVQQHLAVWAPTPPSLSDAVFAAFGYAGESAVARMTRLCAEASVPFTSANIDSELLGPQAPATLLALLREAEETDGGILFERTEGGLGYLRRFDRYNRSVALDLTYGQLAGSLQLNDDDRLTCNDVTATRPNGATSQVIDQDHIDEQGRYDQQVTVNTQTDAVLPNHAGWRVWLGTVDELRCPQLMLNLRNPRVDAGVVAAWLASDIGSRVVASGPPVELAVARIDQLIEGYTEVVDRVEWSTVLNCSPASGWDVSVADGEQRVPADGSALAAALSAGGMSMVIGSTAQNGLWTQDPADFPLDLRVGGEWVTASTIAGALDDQFTRVVPAGGWGGSWAVGLGAGSVASVNGSAALLDVAALNTSYALIVSGLAVRDLEVNLGAVLLTTAPTGGGAYARGVVYVRWQDASNYLALNVHVLATGLIDLQLVRVAAGSTTVLTAVGSGITFTAGISVHARVAADGAAVRARVWRDDQRDPLTWQISGTDPTPAAGTVGLGALLPPASTNALPYRFVFDAFTVVRPQMVTLSARGLNGVQRAWPAGTEVDMWQPAIAAL